MCNIKTSTWLGIIGSFLDTQLLQKSSKQEEQILFFFHYHYRFDPKLGKGVCVIFQIPWACTAYVAQIHKYWLPTIAQSSQPRYARVDNFYYNKILEHYNDCIIMEFLEKIHPKMNLTTFMHLFFQ